MIILGKNLDNNGNIIDCVCKVNIKEMIAITGGDIYDLQKSLKEGKTEFENVSNDIIKAKSIIQSRNKMVSALTGLIEEAKKHIVQLTVEGDV